MRVASRCGVLVVGILLSCWCSAAAQQPDSAMLHRRTGPPSRTIHLDVVVTRKSGEAVAGLQEKDFTLLDDKRPREITSFEAVDAEKQPVEAILLIDAVNTPSMVISQERYQVDRFLRANGGRVALPVTLAVLTDLGVKIQPTYTRDGNLLAASLKTYTIGLREIGRSTGVEGAVERLDDSLKALRLLVLYESQRPGRKIILWVSPGWPLLSGPEADMSETQRGALFSEITWFSERLRERQMTLYAVNPMGVGESVAEVFHYQEFTDPVKKPSGVALGNLGLQVLARGTGGEVLNSSDVSSLLQQCVGENLAYYRISFEPPPTERRDVYHELNVTVAEPGLTPHTSTGYYAEP